MNNEISSSLSNSEQSDTNNTIIINENSNNDTNNEIDKKEDDEMDEYLDNLFRESNPHMFQTRDYPKVVFESEAQLEMACESVYNELIDDILFGQVLQAHRATKLGYLFLFNPESDPEEEKQYELYDDNDVLGVFSNLNENYKPSGGVGRNGQNSIKDQLSKYECSCPNCGRNLAAIRFAPHLEKCMGMGRSSSRIATRRIANYNGDELDQLIEATGLIPNRNYSEPTITSSSSSTNITNDEDIISIINAVATNETVNSGFDGEMLSGSSSSCSINTNNALKPPNAKKKRLQNSKSGANIATMGLASNTSQENNVNNLIQTQKANFY